VRLGKELSRSGPFSRCNIGNPCPHNSCPEARAATIDGWWNNKSKSKTKTVPLMGDSSRGVEDAFQSFRRQRLWRGSRCLRIARDVLSLTGPPLLSRGTLHQSEGQQEELESLGHPPVAAKDGQNRVDRVKARVAEEEQPQQQGNGDDGLGYAGVW